MNASIRPCEPRTRIFAFEGACNFRDVGGYHTDDGRTVRWGRVFRTGVLSYFTPADREALLQLRVRAICDLRRAEERAREPTRWPDQATPILLWEDGERAPKIRALMANRPSTAAGMFDAMIELYRVLPAWLAPRIGGMFESLARGATPLVVHCAAGKDRTGVAIGVLLSALGVPQETVMEDYLLTNQAGDFERFIRAHHDSELGLTDVHHPLLAMPQDMRQVLFSAHEDFLAAAFERIAATPGGLAGYLQDVAGVSAATLERVRAQLTE
ncbi:MAG TPA: tyrosine-protein phosphatase [Steroidobacter sp.]|jgi:protein-tyrosine phosphatase|nr:tyrosine-protein phosphatase [Steroidobacteraceae bacterium]HLS82518.1 tyrosine-protein phosphatase [Steroidobacter sp.]